MNVYPRAALLAALLLAGCREDEPDAYGNFDDEPRPDGEFTETALANWAGVVNKRAKLIFEDSRYGPSEAYGGRRPAT